MELSDGAVSWSPLSCSLGLSDQLCAMFDADGSSLEPQAQKWIKKLQVDEKKYGFLLSKVSFPKLVEIPKLIELPNDYRNVIEMVSNFRCKEMKPIDWSETRDSIPSPAMCLICGKIICTLSKCCEKIHSLGILCQTFTVN